MNICLVHSVALCWITIITWERRLYWSRFWVCYQLSSRERRMCDKNLEGNLKSHKSHQEFTPNTIIKGKPEKSEPGFNIYGQNWDSWKNTPSAQKTTHIPEGNIFIKHKSPLALSYWLKLNGKLRNVHIRMILTVWTMIFTVVSELPNKWLSWINAEGWQSVFCASSVLVMPEWWCHSLCI